MNKLIFAAPIAALLSGCYLHHPHGYHSYRTYEDAEPAYVAPAPVAVEPGVEVDVTIGSTGGAYVYYDDHPVPTYSGGGWCGHYGNHHHDYEPDYTVYSYSGYGYSYRGPRVVWYFDYHSTPGGGSCNSRGRHHHDYHPGHDGTRYRWDRDRNVYSYNPHPATPVATRPPSGGGSGGYWPNPGNGGNNGGRPPAGRPNGGNWGTPPSGNPGGGTPPVGNPGGGHPGGGNPPGGNPGGGNTGGEQADPTYGDCKKGGCNGGSDDRDWPKAWPKPGNDGGGKDKGNNGNHYGQDKERGPFAEGGPAQGRNDPDRRDKANGNGNNGNHFGEDKERGPFAESGPAQGNNRGGNGWGKIGRDGDDDGDVSRDGRGNPGNGNGFGMGNGSGNSGGGNSGNPGHGNSGGNGNGNNGQAHRDSNAQRAGWWDNTPRNPGVDTRPNPPSQPPAFFGGRTAPSGSGGRQDFGTPSHVQPQAPVFGGRSPQAERNERTERAPSSDNFGRGFNVPSRPAETPRQPPVFARPSEPTRELPDRAASQPQRPTFAQPSQPQRPTFAQPSQPQRPTFAQPSQPSQPQRPAFSQPTQPQRPAFSPPSQPQRQFPSGGGQDRAPSRSFSNPSQPSGSSSSSAAPQQPKRNRSPGSDGDSREAPRGRLPGFR